LVKRVKVKLFGFHNRQIDIDADATDGAIIGKNLRWSDGSLVTEDELRNLTSPSSPSGGTPTSNVQATLWELILNIPSIVKSLVGLTDDGWMRNSGGEITATDHLFTKDRVDAGERVVIPEYNQMIIMQDFTLSGGSLTIDGRLFLLEEGL
jgi:hypothetical protein